MRHLIASLGDQSPSVAAAAVRALERLREPSAVMPLYEVVQNEAADPGVRRAAADALVTFGLLRRERVGPSRIFMWLVGIVLLLVAIAAASSIGPLAIILFAAGVAALVYYSVRAMRQERGAGDYIGPDGAAIHAPLDDIAAGGGGLEGFGDGGGGTGG